jgi:hypothetical protein
LSEAVEEVGHKLCFRTDLIAAVTRDDAGAVFLDELLGEGIGDNIATETVSTLDPENVTFADRLDRCREALTLKRRDRPRASVTEDASDLEPSRLGPKTARGLLGVMREILAIS